MEHNARDAMRTGMRIGLRRSHRRSRIARRRDDRERGACEPDNGDGGTRKRSPPAASQVETTAFGAIERQGIIIARR